MWISITRTFQAGENAHLERYEPIILGNVWITDRKKDMLSFPDQFGNIALCAAVGTHRNRKTLEIPGIQFRVAGSLNKRPFLKSV